MSQGAEGTKKLVAFKKKLEQRIEELELELEEQRSILTLVDSIILEKGFKRVEVAKEPAEPEVSFVEEEGAVSPELSLEYEEPVSLLTGSGELLAHLYLEQDSMRIVPAEDKYFNVNTPPFMHFFVERVLEKMEAKDNELALAGQLAPNKIFSFDIIQDGDTIQELVIKNFDNKRLQELKSSIRWTLEKMYEKTNNNA